MFLQLWPQEELGFLCYCSIPRLLIVYQQQIVAAIKPLKFVEWICIDGETFVIENEVFSKDNRNIAVKKNFKDYLNGISSC
jgi:hypothetical protein